MATRLALRRGLVIACCAAAACSSSTSAPPAGDGIAVRDGKSAGDSRSGDGAAVRADRGWPEAGWVLSEQGPVAISDGGVLITEDGGATYICHPTTCAGKLLACGDCQDNDGDGLVDFRDPECLGPCDNTEGPALISGVGGVTGATCGVDCYFDFGNGAGNDQCWWNHQCDTLEPEKSVGCPFDPKLAENDKKCPAEQVQACADSCIPYTPNGCDCFGCCTFPALAGKAAGGADQYVWIGARDPNDKTKGTCTFADIEDPTKCPPCTPIKNCLNPCGPCEVCIGRPVPPAECFKKPPAADGGSHLGDSGPRPDGAPKPADGSAPASDGGSVIDPLDQCPSGDQPCGLPGQSACPVTYYCLSGCCKRTIL